VAQLSFKGIVKTFSDVIAVNDVSMDIASGEFVTLVGASGCGKTTLLRIIAGFTKADSGELTIDGRRIEGLPPSKREVGFVFQSYALFPTQTVAQNIGFSLSIRRRPKSEIAERVKELCELTRLAGMEDRYPHELSGGQQQRVALARALAPNPSILLLDEPLSALDAKIRAHLRTEIRAVVDRLGITAVYVTHDQEEALSISDRVAVMNDGVILQVGAPMEVYLRPAELFVADFIGTTNHLEGRPAGDGKIEIEGRPVAVDIPDALRGQDAYTICVRPESIDLSRTEGGADARVGKLSAFSFLGQTVRVHLLTQGAADVVVDVSTDDWLALALAAGDEVAWRIRPGGAIVFAADEDGSSSRTAEDKPVEGS
jgi:ABC-type Fe3+/spermidine/putrescine transport system ATPase subunit